jgi:hypothetical protein
MKKRLSAARVAEVLGFSVCANIANNHEFTSSICYIEEQKLT